MIHRLRCTRNFIITFKSRGSISNIKMNLLKGFFLLLGLKKMYIYCYTNNLSRDLHRI